MGELVELGVRRAPETGLRIPTDVILLAAQYFAFTKNDSVTGTHLLMKVQQTGMKEPTVMFSEADYKLFKKLEEFAQPEVFEAAKVQWFTGLGTKCKPE